MFSKTKDSSSTPESHTSTSSEPKRSTAKAGVPSIISADLRITGNLKSDGDIQVDGHVEGDIDSATLTVGEGAHVKGHISCESVRVCGTVDGAVKAKSVVMAKTARVIGDIIHDSLAIEAGAFIEGRSDEHTSELQSLMRISYAVFCLKKQNKSQTLNNRSQN